jgi:glutathione-dependent peroxiredoxin
MLFDRKGQQVPSITFRMFVRLLSGMYWYDLSTADLFERKTVVVFTVSGAFFPHSHLQVLGYNAYAQMFRESGVDEILCISVNDPFLLAMWAEATGADRVRFIPDVNADFTRAMGMLVSLWDRGMGQRSWRYSMLVKDETIDKMFIERDGFEVRPMVTDAETMLDYLDTSMLAA